MTLMNNPARYDVWYQSLKGAWIGGLETALLSQLMSPKADTSLLHIL